MHMNVIYEGLGAMVEEKLMQLEEEDIQHWLDILEEISTNRWYGEAASTCIILEENRIEI